MTVFKCKMCGGDLMVNEGTSVCECEYCGSMQTVPSIDDEKKMTLFNRANRLRFNCEFDKAAGVYESIVAEFPEEAEAYWGLVLCKYGIEYVDDPSTAKKIPTCHRSSFDSVMDDKDFEMVMEYSDPVSRRVYREEAKQFENIRRGIIEISGKEEPYDIFICYKETDENGERTLDSVLAQDIYDALTDKGYRVFFSRVTLEDKLGQEYEPYIFAALHSAKIMLAVGTDYEYYNAVWVKNEWSRYLKLIAAGEKKTLIPCYKDIDAYDMPKEFARLQAQDLGKVGAMQDLMRGIEKIIGSKQGKMTETQIASQTIPANPSVNSFLKRVQLFLEEKDWEKATEYCEKVLDIDPENGKAYIGELLVALQVSSIEQLSSLEQPLEGGVEYNKALRFASNDDRKRIEAANQTIKDRINKRKEADRIAAEKVVADRIERTRRIKRARLALGMDPDPAKLAEEKARHSAAMKHLNEERAVEIEKNRSLCQSVEEEKEMRLRLEEEAFFEAKTSIGLEIQRLEKELSSLGIFSGKRKNEINSELNNLNNKEHRLKEEYEAKLAEIEADAEMKCAEIRSRIEHNSQKIEAENNKHRENNAALRPFDQDGFGHYHKIKGESPEPIKWEVLDATDSEALIISKYALDTKPFNNVEKAVTWETCTLRKWLNDTFLQMAFNEKERDRILTTKVTANRNPEYDTDPGNDTNDRIFLLSIDEAKNYFDGNEGRACELISLVDEENKGENASGWWWLRSPGFDQSRAAIVYMSGMYSTGGYGVGDPLGTVRPALWINLEP